ncbi:AsmA family protein [Ramlibacter sp. MMS24-I3-19]|uniref:AsmA family protein n=1 Tax=Ramlibacter sp. MMS24-I3-19 TaxID=3416606 RepID=UPI003CFC231D
MRAQNKWALGLAGGVVVLVGAAVAGLAQWAGSADFRLRAQQAATQALGVPVQLGEVEITYWPALGVAVHDVRVLTRPALTLAQIEATPVWSSLVVGKPVLDALVVRSAVLPQQGILAAVAALQKQAPKAAAAKSTSDPAASLPRRIVLDQVTWVDASQQRLTVNAEIAFAGELLPETAKVDIVGGRYAGAQARLERAGEAWQLRAEIGGGTLAGPLRLQSQKAGGWRLTGDIATDKVEVAALTAPSRALTGKLSARTSLQADFKEPGALVDAMRTQTKFTVHQAVLHGIDLAQAARTLGISRSGQTVFDTLTGQVATQGKVVQLSNLVANSGSLAATGNVVLAADRTLSGKANVTLAGGAIGVPLTVGGTLDAPSASPGLPSLFGGR